MYPLTEGKFYWAYVVDRRIATDTDKIKELQMWPKATSEKFLGILQFTNQFP